MAGIEGEQVQFGIESNQSIIIGTSVCCTGWSKQTTVSFTISWHSITCSTYNTGLIHVKMLWLLLLIQICDNTYSHCGKQFCKKSEGKPAWWFASNSKYWLWINTKSGSMQILTKSKRLNLIVVIQEELKMFSLIEK